MRARALLFIIMLIAGCSTVFKDGSMVHNPCVKVTAWPTYDFDSGTEMVFVKVKTDWPFPCVRELEDAR